MVLGRWEGGGEGDCGSATGDGDLPTARVGVRVYPKIQIRKGENGRCGRAARSRGRRAAAARGGAVVRDHYGCLFAL